MAGGIGGLSSSGPGDACPPSQPEEVAMVDPRWPIGPCRGRAAADAIRELPAAERPRERLAHARAPAA